MIFSASRCNNSFTNHQINALVTFVLNTRPGTIRVFRALEPAVKSLMFEQVTDDLPALFNDESGLQRQNVLTCAHAEDEAALACQRVEYPWTEVDAKKKVRQRKCMNPSLSRRLHSTSLVAIYLIPLR